MMGSCVEANLCISRNTKSETIVDSLITSTDYRRYQESDQGVAENQPQQQSLTDVRMDGHDGRGFLLSGYLEAETGTGYKKNEASKDVKNHHNDSTEYEPQESPQCTNEILQKQYSVDGIDLKCDGGKIYSKGDTEEELKFESCDARTPKEDRKDIFNNDNDFEPANYATPGNLEASTKNRPYFTFNIHCPHSKLSKPYSVYSITEYKHFLEKYCATFGASTSTPWEELAKDGSHSESLEDNWSDCNITEYKNDQNGATVIETSTSLDNNNTHLDKPTIDESCKGFHSTSEQDGLSSFADLSSKLNGENVPVHPMPQQRIRSGLLVQFANKKEDECSSQKDPDFSPYHSDEFQYMSQVSVYDMVQFFEGLSSVKQKSPRVLWDKAFESVPRKRKIHPTFTEDLHPDARNNIDISPEDQINNSSSVSNKAELSAFMVYSPTKNGTSSEDSEDLVLIDESCSTMELEVLQILNPILEDLDEKVLSEWNSSNESEGFASENILFSESESWKTRLEEDPDVLSSEAAGTIGNCINLVDLKEDSGKYGNSSKKDTSGENNVILTEGDVDEKIFLEGENAANYKINKHCSVDSRNFSSKAKQNFGNFNETSENRTKQIIHVQKQRKVARRKWKMLYYALGVLVLFFAGPFLGNIYSSIYAIYLTSI